MNSNTSPAGNEGAAILETRWPDYGDPVAMWEKNARDFSDLLGYPVTPFEAVELLIIVKRNREAFKHKPDNAIDILGYRKIQRMICEKENGEKSNQDTRG